MTKNHVVISVVLKPEEYEMFEELRGDFFSKSSFARKLIVEGMKVVLGANAATGNEMESSTLNARKRCKFNSSGGFGSCDTCISRGNKNRSKTNGNQV